jgi:heme/copper-type cytochrome/quinol oxidase subunit 4
MAEELDDIKALWKKSKEEKPLPNITRESLQADRSKSTLYWIRIILSIEFWISVIALPLVSYYIYNKDQNYFLISVYALITLIYLFYYQFLIKKVRDFSYDGDVVKSLKKIYRYLRSYLLHYKVVIWISLVLGYILGSIESSVKAVEDNNIPEDEVTKFLLITGAVSLVLIVIMGAVMQFLIHLIYGRKIKRLKVIVETLEEQEAE